MRETGTDELGRRQPESIAKPRPRLSTFSALGYRDFRYLWIGMLFSSSGQWIQQVTLSWLIYDMTGSPLMLGLINGIRAIPFLFVGPLGGVAADRMDRRKLIIVTQAALMVSSFILGALILAGLVEVWHLIVFTLITGVTFSFNQPVRQALVPSLVPNTVLANAVALNASAFTMTGTIGPAIAGVLIGSIGAGGNFMIQGFAYLGVTIMTFAMNVPALAEEAKKESVAKNLLEGLRYVRRNEVVLTLIILAIIPQMIAMPYSTLLPIFQKDVFKVGPEVLGLLTSAPSLGSLAATLGLATFSGFRRKGALLIAMSLCLGISLALFGASNWLPLSLVILVGVGGAQLAFFITNNTILQTIVPDRLRGRVMSIYMLDMGLMPLGSLAAGALAEISGAQITVQIMGATCVALGLIAMIKAPHIRKLKL